MSNVALITGITGQDGSYLTELLLSKGYVVHGLLRRSSTDNRSRISHLLSDPRLHLHIGDLTDSDSLRSVIQTAQPTEIYNLASQSHVGVSFTLPIYTSDVVGLGFGRLLEAARCCAPSARIYQASTSEIFGQATAPQSESTPLNPCNPYAAAKVYALHMARIYRESHGVFVANGILFNHESERRGENFVTRKITRAVGRIAAGTQKELLLGRVDARRDWGHAADYVRAMWLILQHETPEDFVIATGQSHSVEEFAERAFAAADLDWRDYTRTDPALLRPTDIPDLVGDARRAHHTLHWRPEISFDRLIQRMVEHDIKLALRERN